MVSAKNIRLSVCRELKFYSIILFKNWCCLGAVRNSSLIILLFIFSHNKTVDINVQFIYNRDK